MSVMCIDLASIFVPAATFGQLTRTDSRHNCKYARWKARAILWLWETDYYDSASLGNLIQIREQLDLIMICAQDIRFQRVIVFTRDVSSARQTEVSERERHVKTRVHSKTLIIRTLPC